MMQQLQRQLDATDLSQFPAVSGGTPAAYVADSLVIETAEWTPMALPPAAVVASKTPSFAQAATRRSAAAASGPAPSPAKPKGGLQPLRSMRTQQASSGSDGEDPVPATFRIDISFASVSTPPQTR